MAFDEQQCLGCDMFAGDDYGNSMQHDFGAKIVTGRGEYECQNCFGPIAKGERHRVDRCIMDGEYLTARFCGLCCEAMTQEDGKAICDRTFLWRTF